jgi:hypothetical protein
MPSRVLEPLQFPAVRPVRDDLFVRAVSVQGGESDIAGEKTAFARITMTGVGLASSATSAPAPRRQETAVLKLSEAEDLAAQLGELLSFMARSTPTPPAPAMGLWAWRSEPPLDDDLLVADASAGAIAVQMDGRVTPTVRVEFTGIAVQELALSVPPVLVQRAVFSGPRQVQILISSLKKVVRSALEQRRTDVYIPSGQSTPVLRLIS